MRCFVAKARTFHFPLDVQEEPDRIIGNPGERSLQHLETMFPLWYRQMKLLTILVEERREKHMEWANKHKTCREFAPGDLVVVRRQIQSSAATGRPAKLRIRARGPYRVLEKAGKNSYWIQKIPVVQELTRHRRSGLRQKQAASRLERIPSSVVVHKRMDSMDTRWGAAKCQVSRQPVGAQLGILRLWMISEVSRRRHLCF